MLAISTRGWVSSVHVSKCMLKSIERSRKARPATILLLIVLTALCIQSTRPTAVRAASGRVIDLYTQKAPFDGRGMNQSSDAFQPQELVILYAVVTYNDAPVAQKLVSFLVNGPSNPYQNITVAGSSRTDLDGIANFSFRLPWPTENPEGKIFGKWFALATVEIGDQAVVDTLTFNVGYLVRITNIATFNAQLNPQTRFLRQEMIVFNLTIENIAMTPKSGTITIDVQDATGHPIIHIETENQVFQPGIMHVPASSQIPVTATLGQASILAAVYIAPPENGGVLYSPSISSTFEIITRDVAVIAVRPWNVTVATGETLNITVTVKNKGNETESFNVALYYDNILISKKPITGLVPQMETSIVFEWNTSGAATGSYVIKGVADKVEGEIDVGDNIFVDGTVIIFPTFFPFVTLDWIFLLFMFIIALMGSLILLLFIGYLKRRKRKRPPSRIFTVVARPHV